jgi:hypothetical protein
MIQMPRRSVTRFFIPMIDVLTLLFCIFLLLPLVRQSDPAPESAAPTRPAGPTESAADEKAGSERVRRERQELDDLQKAKIETLQNRLFIRVLEIDPESGKLLYHEDNQTLNIASDVDMQRLIERQRPLAGTRELFYVVLYPRRSTGFPELQQVQQYERWLNTVAHVFDIPRAKH